MHFPFEATRVRSRYRCIGILAPIVSVAVELHPKNYSDYLEDDGSLSSIIAVDRLAYPTVTAVDRLEAYPTVIAVDRLEAYPTVIAVDRLEAYPTCRR